MDKSDSRRKLTPGGIGTPLSCALVVVMTMVTIGCSSSRAHRGAEIEALSGGADVPEDALLDVQILVFDPDLPEDEGDLDDRVYPAIRKAEANYFPCQLRQTLASTGQWGAVEVAPRRSDAFELTVQGKIIRSDGEKLEVEIEAVDATGRRWLRRQYKIKTTEAQHEDTGRDPYQVAFNEIANDLVEMRAELTDKELRNIRTISELRFAENFAPDEFGGYLEEDGERLHIVRLPAREDPMMVLLAEVRGREAMFISTQSRHFESFCGQMAKPYTDWRRLAREEAIAYGKLRRGALLRKGAAIGLVGLTIFAGTTAPPGTLRNVAIIAGAAGSAATWASGMQKQTEADFHKDTLEELDRSFQGEVQPMVIEVEGRTVRLTGTVEEQYEKWRRLLAEIYRAETDVSRELDIRIEND
jgi:hypothetical protein